MVSIKAADLSNAIAATLAAYSSEVEEKMEQVQNDVSKDAVKALKQVSHPRDTGAYAKSWARKKNRAGGYVIYNRDHYQLTHLLEHGHAKVGGGRVAGIPHIGPVEEDVIRRVLDETREVLGR